ncbi:MAG: hypothetical protein OXF94_06825 [Gammaproteobacteria bacterium]|nr:hypothetical protein [Gammaproteobacteria bacterium]
MTDNPGYTADFIKSDTDRATFMKDPAMDHLMAALVSVSTEIWAQARRMKIMERLLEDHGKVTREMIEGYMPSAEEEASWRAERDRFIERTFGSLTAGHSFEGQPTRGFHDRPGAEGPMNRSGMGGDQS